MLFDDREILTPFEVDASPFELIVDVDARGTLHLDVIDRDGRSVVQNPSDIIATMLR